ncbi:MAG: SUMF1/EgtB/PvdO family nonheme iron enzyme, partial [Verrucomicrobiales bacterium]
DHPGLVNVLHVGRSADGESFYYYVMELGDDIITGCEINPIEYEARTLRNDITSMSGKRLETAFCLDVGHRLAEALEHLHVGGLAHRDVKPSNVIFVNGRAKLADIGLVAARGQRTFVGTEGFVPPEGPGSAQADVYSLGKVLYEMATGRDRLDFPELPEDLPVGPERKVWLALNQIICDVCDPHISRRTIKSAGELANALERLRMGKRRRRRRPVGPTIVALCGGGILMWGGWEAAHSERVMEWVGKTPVSPPPAEKIPAFIKVTSTPDGADVIDVVDESGMGELIGRTPTRVLESYVGENLSFRILREGYRPHDIRTVVPASAAQEPWVLSAELRVFAPPAVDEPWVDQLGVNYRPLGEGHESIEWVDGASWARFATDHPNWAKQGQVLEQGQGEDKRTVVVASPGAAGAFCNWLVGSGIDDGFLTVDHEAIPKFTDKFPHPKLSGRAKEEKWKPFRVEVRQIPYGRLMITTVPTGAEIYVNGVSQGTTDGGLIVERIRPGKLEVMASLEGYKLEKIRVQVADNGTEILEVKLEQNKSVVLDRPWENSLGMKLVPIGESWMSAVWETRRADYAAFAAAKGLPVPPPPEWSVDGNEDRWLNHPVVSVSRDDAMAFCEWLTEKEIGEDRLKRSLEYRLPTDWEWSVLAGLDEEWDASPSKRDQLSLMRPKWFPWGEEWPPVGKVANLADESADFPADRRIFDYDDGFPVTAPVGSFEPNEWGIHDLCGNVQEWVEDSYSRGSASGLGVLRGGGWATYQESDLDLGARNPQPPSVSDETYGFRVVLSEKRLDIHEVETLNRGSNGGD